MNPIYISAVAAMTVGSAVVLVGCIVLFRRLANLQDRIFATGIIYVGMSLMAVGTSLLLLAALSEARLPVIAAAIPIAAIAITGLRLQLAGRRAFRRAAMAPSGAADNPSDIRER